MEPKFQTSFIPKQSLAPSPAAQRRSASNSRAFGLGTVIAIVIFIGAVSASVLLFLYEQYLTRSIQSNQASLERAREAFEPALIKELGRLDDRINAANIILNQHIAPSALFTLLESITLQNVQFTSFSYTGEGTNGMVAISLSGKAKSFQTVALQSDLLGSNSYLKNTVVSELALDASGDVTFQVNANVDPRFLSYLSKVQKNPSAPSGATETVPVENQATSTNPSI